MLAIDRTASVSAIPLGTVEPVMVVGGVLLTEVVATKETSVDDTGDELLDVTAADETGAREVVGVPGDDGEA